MSTGKKIKKIVLIILAVIAILFVLLIVAGLGYSKRSKAEKHAHRSPIPGTDIYEYSTDEYMQYQKDHPELFNADDVIEYEMDPNVLAEEAQNGIDSDDVDAKFLKFLEPADDEWDYKYAQDAEMSNTLGFVHIKDSKANEYVFGTPKPTLEDIYESIDGNTSIDEKYNKFLKDYAKDWLTLWPDTDFTIFNYNMKSLEIETLTPEEIQRRTMSAYTVACYMNLENKICINSNCNFEDKSSNDYVVFVHEITHAARTCKTNIDKKEIAARFYDSGEVGLYEDECLATWFAYKLQGLDNKSIYYTFPSSIYRQIFPYMDYDGADYINHSFSYFLEKMQEYFDEIGMECPAYHFTNLVDCKCLTHYRKYTTPVITQFDELYEALVFNYAKNHINENMTLAETDREFENMWEDLTFNFENIADPYPEMTKESYRTYWDEYVSSLGIE